MSAYGAPWPSTPHLDALSRRGLLAEHAISATDLTNPSHATIFTGLPPAAHGVHSLRAPLPEAVETLAETLRGARYATAAIVSVNHLRSDMSGLHQGFDVYDVPMVERDGDEAAILASQCLRGRRAPFFLWLHLFDAHMPYEPPTPWRELALASVPPERPVPPLADLIENAHVPFPYREWLAGRDLGELRALYLAEIGGVDHALARAVGAALRADPSAAIVVTADHGEGFGEHGVYWNHFGLHEEMIRVPLVIAAPSLVPPGIVRAPAFPSAELQPAILALLAPRGGRLELDFRPTAVCEMRHRAARALVRGSDKIIEQMGNTPPLKRGTALYELEGDPGEERDLAAARPSQAAALASELHGIIASQERRLRARASEAVIDDATRERLRSLGYLD